MSSSPPTSPIRSEALSALEDFVVGTPRPGADSSSCPSPRLRGRNVYPNVSSPNTEAIQDAFGRAMSTQHDGDDGEDFSSGDEFEDFCDSPTDILGLGKLWLSHPTEFFLEKEESRLRNAICLPEEKLDLKTAQDKKALIRRYAEQFESVLTIIKNFYSNWEEIQNSEQSPTLMLAALKAFYSKVVTNDIVCFSSNRKNIDIAFMTLANRMLPQSENETEVSPQQQKLVAFMLQICSLRRSSNI